MLYIAGRIIGKIIGVHLGATWGNVDPKIKKYLGLGILSQAGVAIGLSLIAKSKLTQLAVAYDFSRAMSLGVTVLTTITATSLFFEIAGPISTRFALFKAGEIPHLSGKGKKNNERLTTQKQLRHHRGDYWATTRASSSPGQFNLVCWAGY